MAAMHDGEEGSGSGGPGGAGFDQSKWLQSTMSCESTRGCADRSSSHGATKTWNQPMRGDQEADRAQVTEEILRLATPVAWAAWHDPDYSTCSSSRNMDGAMMPSFFVELWSHDLRKLLGASWIPSVRDICRRRGPGMESPEVVLNIPLKRDGPALGCRILARLPERCKEPFQVQIEVRKPISEAPSFRKRMRPILRDVYISDA